MSSNRRTPGDARKPFESQISDISEKNKFDLDFLIKLKK